MPGWQCASATSVASRYVRDRRGKARKQGAYKRISQQQGNSEGVNESLLQGRSYETFTLFLNFVSRWIACAVGGCLFCTSLLCGCGAVAKQHQVQRLAARGASPMHTRWC